MNEPDMELMERIIIYSVVSLTIAIEVGILAVVIKLFVDWVR